MEPFVMMAVPLVVASYVGEKTWQHRRHWFKVPAGWRLPKIEVACLAAALGSFVLAAYALTIATGGRL